MANEGSANSARIMIWCAVFDFRFENIERFRGFIFWGTLFRNFAPRFIMDSVREFLLGTWVSAWNVSFCLVDGQHSYVHRRDFQKIEKFHSSFINVGEIALLTLQISISKYCKFLWCIVTDLSVFIMFYADHILLLMLFRGLRLFSYLPFCYEPPKLKGSN